MNQWIQVFTAAPPQEWAMLIAPDFRHCQISNYFPIPDCSISPLSEVYLSVTISISDQPLKLSTCL